MVEIFKQFEYLHDFKLQTFRTTLDDSLILNDNSNDTEFTSVVMIPYLKIQKKRNVWNVTLLVANQFYEYNFPFQFTDYFIHWETTHQFEVKTQIIQLIAQTTFKKKLDVEEFLKPFDKVSNAKKTRVKKIFIEGIEQEIQNRSIQSKFHIVQKSKHCDSSIVERPSSPENVKHIVNAIELSLEETHIAKTGLIEGAKKALADQLRVEKESISDKTALQGIIFLNEEYTIERID